MNPILARMNTNFGIMLGRMELAKLEIYAKNANKVQETVLKSLMKKNKNTVYGKKNNFADVHSYEDYKKLVPLTNYYDYDEYVQRMANGEKNLNTAAFVRRFTSHQAVQVNQNLYHFQHGLNGFVSASVSVHLLVVLINISNHRAKKCHHRRACSLQK